MEKDDRNLEGKLCIFIGNQTEPPLNKYINRKCVVLKYRGYTEKNGTMWDIEFDDGYKDVAYADEILDMDTINHVSELIKNGFKHGIYNGFTWEFTIRHERN